jgi:hypothetical protein
MRQRRILKTLSCTGLQNREANHDIIGVMSRALRDQPEGASAARAFILMHVVPVAGGLDADQISFEVAAHAVWCSSHVCRLFP